MSERSHYQAGVPCWVDTLQPDPEAAMAFYRCLFGWEFIGPGPMPGDPPGQYFVATFRGRDVAGVGSQVGVGLPPMPAWSTYISVANVDDALRRVGDAGGKVVAGPMAASPAGRFAAVSDPAGAVFCVWEPEVRHGAQLVNEPSAWAMSMLHTSDPDGAKAFYGDVFGWIPEAFEMGGAEGTLWRLPGYVGGEPGQPVPRDVVGVMVPIADGGPGQATPHWSVDFWIDDADAAAAKAPSLGGSVVVAPFDAPGFRTAVLADPHGAVISVSTLLLGH
jgi:predicted enzyme related to lactoylglutathione lyase